MFNKTNALYRYITYIVQEKFKDKWTDGYGQTLADNISDVKMWNIGFFIANV